MLNGREIGLGRVHHKPAKQSADLVIDLTLLFWDSSSPSSGLETSVVEAPASSGKEASVSYSQYDDLPLIMLTSYCAAQMHFVQKLA